MADRCENCGAETHFGNRLCDYCHSEVAGSVDCPNCGKVTERIGHLCLSCSALVETRTKHLM